MSAQRTAREAALRSAYPWHVQPPRGTFHAVQFGGLGKVRSVTIGASLRYAKSAIRYANTYGASVMLVFRSGSVLERTSNGDWQRRRNVLWPEVVA